MDRIIFGDNQFFAVNHISDEKSRAQSIRFKSDEAIVKVLDDARAAGIQTFMCTTHDRIANICDVIRSKPGQYKDFKIFPCMPYAHKYANAVTELGIAGTLKQYVPGNFFGSLFKGGMAYLSKDYESIMELMVDAEMKMFKGIPTPVIFLQNVITDLLLGLHATDILVAFGKHVKRKYNAQPGFITMNLPLLIESLKGTDVPDPVLCASINKVGFRMSGGRAAYEEVLKTTTYEIMAMQVLGGGSIPAREALAYVCGLPNVASILFGASSRTNIEDTVNNIRKFDQQPA